MFAAGRKETKMTDKIEDEVCEECGGWDIEWMKECPVHRGTKFCRGCECPHCLEEEEEDDEESYGFDENDHSF